MQKRILWAAVVAICLIGFSVGLNAQRTNWPEIHLRDDAQWAERSGLALQEVRRLRQLAGISDTSSDMIDNIDTSVSDQHGLVVFASYGGSAKCVNFWIFLRSNGDFRQIWSIEQAGDQANFCADPRCSVPVVRIRHNQDLAVEIPSFRAGHCAVHSVGLFKWNGAGYTYEGVVETKGRAKAK